MKFKARGDISQCDVYSGPSNALPPRCGPRLNSFWFSRLVYGVTQADLGLVNSPASAKGIAGITVQVFCYRVGGGVTSVQFLKDTGVCQVVFQKGLM